MSKNLEPDIDICRDCGEHAAFYCCENAENGEDCEENCPGDTVSNCCGAGPYDSGGDYNPYDEQVACEV